MRDRHMPDWLILLIAGWLFITPWFYDFAAVPAASMNAWIVGILVAICAVAALARYARWQPYAIMAFGAWTILVPWFYGGLGIQPLFWNFELIGLLLIAIAAWSLAKHRSPAAGHA